MGKDGSLVSHLETLPRLEGVRLAQRIGRYPYFRRVDDLSGPEITVDGKRCINLGSNNYLGLAQDGRVKDAAVTPEKRTKVAPVNPLPVMTTVVPPVIGPEPGDTAVTTGRAVAT